MLEKAAIKKIFATISSLRDNVPQDDIVDSEYVDVFNEQVQKLITLGRNDFEEFKVQPFQLKPLVVTISPSSGRQESAEKGVQRGLFLIKIDTILKHFSIENQKQEIGFHP